MPISQVYYEPAADPPEPADASNIAPNKPAPRTAKQDHSAREAPDAPSPQPVPPKRDAVGVAVQESPPVPSRTPDGEMAAEQDESPPESIPTEQPGNVGRDFRNRFDSARSRIRNDAQNTEELPELLDQAVTLLETLANHPATTDYSAIKQRLDNVEQILHSSANVR